MGLTPDEIAHRAFTPSVDGYHQGEVRSFLGRVAAQLRGILSALPEGRAELIELTTTLHDHEPQLASLSERLHAAVADLTAAATMMQKTQAETSSNLELVRAQLADRSPARDSADDASAHIDIVAEYRTLLDRLEREHQAVAAQLDVAMNLAAEQREAAEHLASTGQQQTTQLDAAGKLIERQAEVSEAGDRLVAQLSELALARPLPVASVAPAAATRPPGGNHSETPSAEAIKVRTPFGSDLANQPLFSDNANDLLDSVLDDVLGKLTDEGEPT